MKRFLSLILTFFFLISIAQGELSLTEKVETKGMPSIAAPWAEWLVNRPELSYAEMTAYHDMFWSPEFSHRLALVDGEVKLIGDLIPFLRVYITLAAFIKYENPVSLAIVALEYS